MTPDLTHQDHLLASEIAVPVAAPKKKKRLKQTGLSWLDDPHSAVKGETGLWIAVITQALVDALCKSENPELRYHKDEAIRWLTSNHSDFIYVCQLADLDPDCIRRKAKKAIASPTAWRAAPGFGKRYVERKLYRQRVKENKTTHAASSLHPTSDESEGACKILSGPWQQHI